jgi:hypothetical protein
MPGIVLVTARVQRADLELVGGSHSLLVDVTTALLSRIPEGKRRAVRKTLRPLRSVLTNKSKASPEIPLLRRLEQIKTDVENIRVPLGKPQSPDFSFQPNESWNAKQQSLHQILREKKPRSVLDIASGSGWFSGLAAQFSDAVAAFDQPGRHGRRLRRDEYYVCADGFSSGAKSGGAGGARARFCAARQQG